jgi:hypothetical protein
MGQVRRLVAFLVVAVLGAAAFGLSGTSSGLSVNNANVSGATFRNELAAIASTPAIQCYLTALDPVSFASGGGSATMAASGAAAWANLRVEGLSITQYVKSKWHYVANASQLAAAKTSLISELSQAATAKSYTCPASSAVALADMPTEMQKAEIKDQASSLYLVSKLDGTIPLTTKSMQTYYNSHVADYDTVCVSIAVVAPAKTAAFTKAAAGGESVAALAKQFSLDASGQTGGAYGCFSPSSTSYSSVRADEIDTALNTFSTTPQYISYNGATDALFVAPTKRTVTPYAQAASAVLSDLQSLNASTANTQEEKILYQSAVGIDPAFGRWGLGSTGPTVFVPAEPNKVDVTRAKSLTTGVTSYQ